MCGIGVSLWSTSSALGKQPSGVPKASLQRRGPDAQVEMVVGDLQTAGFELHLTATVLHMRGETCRPQPLQNDAGDALLWNGEIFGGGVAVGEDESDTERLLLALSLAASHGDADAVPQVLGSLHGPWAVAYWHAASRTLWYGRDGFGRRSLLRADAHACRCSVLLLCSVAAPLPPLLAALPCPPDDGGGEAVAPAWHELPTSGLGRVRVAPGGGLTHTWVARAATLPPPHPLPRCVCAAARPPADGEPVDADAADAAVAALLAALSGAVRRRVRGVPPAPGGSGERGIHGGVGGDAGRPRSAARAAARVGLLFSGGIDSMVLVQRLVEGVG